VPVNLQVRHRLERLVKAPMESRHLGRFGTCGHENKGVENK